MLLSRFTEKRGFTLFELLIVISIIGLIAILLLLSFSNIREKARDTRRLSDLAQIRAALELYFDDRGFYPPAPAGYDVQSVAISNNVVDWGDLEEELGSYMPRLPIDPVNSPGCDPRNNGCHAYGYANVGRFTYPAQYDLYTNMENPNHQQTCGIQRWNHADASFNKVVWCTAWGGCCSNEIYEASLD